MVSFLNRYFLREREKKYSGVFSRFNRGEKRQGESVVSNRVQKKDTYRKLIQVRQSDTNQAQ